MMIRRHLYKATDLKMVNHTRTVGEGHRVRQNCARCCKYVWM